MMHYGFCRKHADQTGEGGCPECAMDYQQATILAMTETAKEASRIHVEMHNQIVALEAALGELIEVSDLRGDIDEIPHPCDDPKLWTARLIQAWEDARDLLAPPQEPRWNCPNRSMK